MAVYCLVSAGGSPGVTTTALALALSWPGEVVLAECDPAGRRVLPGYLAQRFNGSPGPGLLGLAMALDHQHAGRESAVRVEDFTIPLDERRRAWLLHGIRDPRHAGQVNWQLLADAFIGASTVSGLDVIIDAGRVGGSDTPTALLQRADGVVMVLGRSLAQVDAAQPRLDALRSLARRVGLCLIDSGPYGTSEIRKALFGLPVVAELPHSPADARVLSDGASQRLSFRTSLLMRATTHLGEAIRHLAREPAGPAGLSRSGVPGGEFR
ncbi:hypothetical protein [Actinoallomurus iriomotensis]|uniref:Uncharacterized protein n=1 Tax=Actinoallomurus iriomotensis TaxID=478107 RepID=A0A9W6S5C1_9ACTN|nr:hypothetical protein [Actinoallomurus iriomotensis]GLY86022.1 hypothetical protein Airi02_039510 [Actinoallomurus iriomotensis]